MAMDAWNVTLTVRAMATVTADMPADILAAMGRTGLLPSFEKHRVNHFVMRHCFLPALLISKL